MNQRVVKLAYKLCSIPSISNDEGELLRFLTSLLRDEGFLVDKIPVSEGRYNIFAYRQAQPVYSVILCTHIDTVAPYVKPRLDDDAGILWGRGSCDAKGIAATMIYAALADYDAGFDDFALLFTVGEEEASDGAKACLPTLASRARYVVVGEPTQLRAASAQKGCLVFDLVAQGIEAHSSQPERGDSAIHKLVVDIAGIISHSWPNSADYGQTLVNFGSISGGSMRNVLAKEAHAKGIMRTSVDNALLIEKIINSLSAGIDMQILSSQNPFLFHTPSDFPQFLAGFGSDAPYLRGVGTPMLIGPGSLHYAHRPDEHIRYDELAAGVLAYGKILQEARKNAASA